MPLWNLAGNLSSINAGNTTGESLAFIVVNLAFAASGTIIILVQLVALYILHCCRTIPFQVRYLGTSFLAGDLFSGLIFVVHQVVIYVFGYDTDFLFNTRILAAGVSSTITWASVMAISCERVLALKLSLRYANLLSERAVILVIVLIWVFHPILLGILFYFSNKAYCDWNVTTCDVWEANKVSRLVMMALLQVYEIALLFFSCIIYRILKKHIRNIKAMSRGNGMITGEDATIAMNAKPTQTVILVAATFVALHAPLVTHLAVFELLPEMRPMLWRRGFHIFAYTCLQINSVLSSYFYIWKFKECKLKFYQTFLSCTEAQRNQVENMRVRIYNIVTNSNSSNRVV